MFTPDMFEKQGLSWFMPCCTIATDDMSKPQVSESLRGWSNEVFWYNRLKPTHFSILLLISRQFPRELAWLAEQPCIKRA